MEFETASSGAIYVKIDRKRKIAVHTLLKALGMNEAQMRDAFKHVDQGRINYLDVTFEKDPSKAKTMPLLKSIAG